MTKYKQQSLFVFGSLFLTLASCSNKKSIDPNASSQLFETPPIKVSSADSIGPTTAAITSVAQVAAFEGELRENDLYRYPEVTIAAKVANPQKAAGLIREAGGRIDYDPNFGSGSRIPFLIFTLPPQKLVDLAFITSLELSTAEISTPKNAAHIETTEDSTLTRDMSVPLADIRVPQFRERSAGKGLGENTIIAVIDTGIDASHPTFNDRVVYWADHTQELRSLLTATTIENGKLKLSATESMEAPNTLDTAAPIYTARIRESAFAAQFLIAERAAGAQGVDINRNANKSDTFLVLVGTMNGSTSQVAYVDTNGNGSFDTAELANPIADFNDARGAACRKGRTAPAGTADMLRFASRGRSVAYPLLLERENGIPKYVSLGIDLRMHGTHVAGIAAGNGAGIQGAAPNAKLMSLKVCSGLSCTSAAMYRGILDAFYNPSACIPDVVNISLGSPQQYKESSLDILIRDLSAKFGTTFFVSAGNSGPGYRTQNHFSAFGPAVMVGAHVSAAMRQQLYLGNPTQDIPADTLFSFSSAGPSFTGMLRPNIIAPGAAFSSTPLAGGGSDMYNGTSMAAPITTGGAAALLSLAKTQTETAALLARREAKITELLSGTDTTANSGSMLGYVMALRTAMENSARALPNLTSPQQGYGLLDIPAAYDAFLQKLQGLNEDRYAYAELDINGNTEASRLYTRTGENARVRPIVLTLRDDGEANDAYHLRIRNTPLEVVLKQIEIQSQDGSVEVISVTDANIASVPFSILEPGQIAQGSTRRTTILVGNTLANAFTSYRKIENMVPGKTYSARYEITINGERTQTIVDLVHIPLLFSDQVRTVNVPAIDPNPISKATIIGFSGQDIRYSAMHRYPVFITDKDSGMHISLGIDPSVTGTLLLQVYDPDGKKCLDTVASRTPVAALARADAKITGECVRTKSGIYEVLVSAGSGRWTSNSKYDLLLEASRVRVGAEKITLATKASHAAASVAREKVLSVNFDARQTSTTPTSLGDLSITATSAKFFERPAIPVQAHRWTFKRISMPPASILGDKTKVDLTVSLSDENKPDVEDTYLGQIDNKLYKLSTDGANYEAVKGAQVTVSEGKTKFSQVDVKSGTPFYIAIETYSYLVSAKGQGPNILWDFLWDLVPPGLENGLAVETSYQADSGVALVSIKAPEDLTGIAAEENAVPRIQAELEIKGGSLQTIKVPVTVLH